MQTVLTSPVSKSFTITSCLHSGSGGSWEDGFVQDVKIKAVSRSAVFIRMNSKQSQT